MECFSAEISQFFTEKRQNLALDGRLGTHHQIQAFHGFS